ncbi:hypothetical protein PHYPO_G00105660 [Pangasianodon hypophthalmus]|uniref:Uncharacterized protein n=1 Tax=Pangasianodon hypophthalmus TaxID=310915 RepID=A0A5N5PX36_PANHP|nr:hypothetical protein PHYPO_G00105660 [Pangasianodon hypophthalmus]
MEPSSASNAARCSLLHMVWKYMSGGPIVERDPSLVTFVGKLLDMQSAWNSTDLFILKRGVLIVKFAGKLSKDPLLCPHTFSSIPIRGLTRASTAARGFIRNQT